MTTQLPILKHIAAVADPTRCRLLRVLERQELTVSELCALFDLPQSTVSRHLKTLADDGWVLARRAGTSHFYAMAPGSDAANGRRLWPLIREELEERPVARQDDRRLAEVLDRRRSRTREFFSSAAGQWDRLRDALFGPQFHLPALLALLDDRWVVGDLGCGTGRVTQALAPYVGRVVAVDGSEEMLDAARERLAGAANVDLRQGELESLPIENGTLEAALLVLVLHYLPDPARVLAEAARALRPGGRLLVVDMLPHEDEEHQRRLGYVWPGFSSEQVTRYLDSAGFQSIRIHPLPHEPGAEGPSLFTAAARSGGCTG